MKEENNKLQTESRLAKHLKEENENLLSQLKELADQDSQTETG